MGDIVGDGMDPYQPFGDDWRKEMMRFSKRRLIEFLLAKWYSDKSMWPERMLELNNENEALRNRIVELELECRGANAVIAEIERQLPGWEKYRDLSEAVMMRIAELEEQLKKKTWYDQLHEPFTI